MVQFEDEILIKDSSGRFKVLRGGKLYDLVEEPRVMPQTAASTSKLTDEVLKKSGIVLSEDLKERFAEIVEAYSKDVRDRFETKSTLTRGTSQGGMGLTPEQADLVIKLIRDVKAEKLPKAASLRKPLPRAGVIPEAEPKAAPAPEPKTPELPPGVREFVFSRADEAEILAAKQKLPKTMAGIKPAEAEKIVKEIIDESKIILVGEARKKLEGILLTHLKDIRDGFETRETLSGEVGPKGINLTPDQLEKILGIARDKFQKLEERTKKTELQKIKIAMDEEKAKSGEIEEKTFGGVKAKMDARWQEITKKEASPMAVPEELMAPPVGVRLGAAGITPKVFAAPRAPSTQEITSSETAGRESGVSSALPARTKTPFDLPEEEKPKPLQILKPSAPTRVRRPMPQQDNRPRLDDVKYVPKLVGPVEELREMTVIDWRRLGANPAAAAAKVKEKIDLLEREDFAKKIAGTKAWQESEVNKLYLEIGRESMEKGLSVDKIIAEREKTGQITISAEEYRAIMNLNRALRY
ncbi:hypothetical protein HZB93_04590 [Candidatus Falkowbacteria bacterium]|nr:hypothetical protein [Candidatus Falkowbacteria bacterium]